MLRAALVVLCLGQTVYEWTDAQGQTHFTDDPSTIPAKARRKEFKPDPRRLPVEVVSDAAAPDAGPGDAGVPVDTCALARERIRAIEELIRVSQASAADRDERAGLRCRQLSLTLGEAALGLCHIDHPEDFQALDAGVHEARARLEVERENLRRAQVRGCR